MGITLGEVTLAVSIAFVLHAAYQLVNILTATPVDAYVVSYEEDDHYDPGTETMQTSVTPVYRYTFNGEVKTLKSKYSLFFSWLRRDTRRIYVSRSGKVFEPAGIAVSLVSALVFFLIV